MSMNFRIKDLLITVLPKDDDGGCGGSRTCDAGCSSNATGCTAKSGGDISDPDWLIDPAELTEIKIALQQVMARIDIALYKRQMMPKNNEERKLLQEKLEQAVSALKQKG